MDNTFEDVLNARDRLAASLRERPRRIQAVAGGDQQALLDRFAARLQAATRAKAQAIERHDEEIRYYAELVAQLKAGVARDQSRATEAHKEP